MKNYSIKLTSIPGIPLINNGDNLGKIIIDCLDNNGIAFEERDVLVVTSKIVSKAEGRLVFLSTVNPSKKAEEIATISGKDPRIVELMMKEGRIVNVSPGIIETIHNLGFLCTSAGIDRANTSDPKDESVSLLPLNPDKSAKMISDEIFELMQKRVGVVIADSLGVRYRAGSIGLAVGVAEIPAILKGSDNETDLYGKKRNVNISFADEIAAASSLLMGQSDAGLPVILVQGLKYPRKNGSLQDLISKDQLEKDFPKSI